MVGEAYRWPWARHFAGAAPAIARSLVA